MRQRIRQMIALGLLCLVLGCAFAAYGNTRNTFLAGSTVFFLVAIGLRVYDLKTRDPYSLETLREMVIDGYYDDPDVPDVDPEGDLYCMKCDSVYNAKFRFCPKCTSKGSCC